MSLDEETRLLPVPISDKEQWLTEVVDDMAS
jgi:hypothetical protein